MSRDQSALLPEKIKVVFRACKSCVGGSADGAQKFYEAVVNLSSIVPTDPGVLPNLTGAIGTIRTVRDSATPLFVVGSANPTNKAALDALAAQYAQDYVDWATANLPGDVVYGGIIAPDMNGLIDDVEWAYTAEHCFTRLKSPPYNGEPDEFQRWDPAATAPKPGSVMKVALTGGSPVPPMSGFTMSSGTATILEGDPATGVLTPRGTVEFFLVLAEQLGRRESDYPSVSV